MTNLELYFYGAGEPKEYLFFKNLGVSIFLRKQVAIDPENPSDHMGLFFQSISGNKFVDVDFAGTALNHNKIETAGFFYFAYQTDEVIEQIKAKMEADLSYRIYFLCHTYFDYKSEFEKLIEIGIDLTRISFVVSPFGRVSQVLTEKHVKSFSKEIDYNEVIFIKPFKKIEKKINQEKSLRRNIVIQLLPVVRAFLQPIIFLKIQLERLRGEKIVILNRVFELLDFLIVIVNFLLFKLYGIFVDIGHLIIRVHNMTVMRLFYQLRHISRVLVYSTKAYFVRSMGVGRVASVKSYFLVRHTVLMSYFKSFGILVDAYYFTKRIVGWVIAFVKVILIRLGFGLKHLILMTGFKLFGLLVDLKNLMEYFIKVPCVRLAYFVRHIFLMSYFKCYGISVDSFNFIHENSVRIYYRVHRGILTPYYFFRAIAIQSFYFIRHILLMTAFKSYGFLVDSYYVSKTILWYLSYPLLKIYWFTRFQYLKRIKKSI